MEALQGYQEKGVCNIGLAEERFNRKIRPFDRSQVFIKPE